MYIHIIAKVCLLSISIALSSCRKFVEIAPPRTDLIKATVFTSDETAQAAISDIYYQIGVRGFASGTISSITMMGSLSSDELVNGITFDDNYRQINGNEILSSNLRITALWQDVYFCIFKCNAVLEGLAGSVNVTDRVKNQLIGEAKFLRAFSHFYLVNLFGDIPLVLTTDYKNNQNIPRTDKALVYQQIVADLVDAKSLLTADYSFSSNQKVRVNKVAAISFLARVYLYLNDWTNAEIQSSEVLSNAGYALEPILKKVFLKNSVEAIWQFYPSTGYPGDLLTFYSYGHLLSSPLLNSFESGDRRATDWNISTRLHKYQSLTTYTEYSMVLRLGEQYLIRAEAQAQQNNILGSQTDLNAIRNRAGLANTLANDKASLLAAIEHERRVELFLEWGHRWFDLKRTNRINAVMSPLKANWVPTDALYPIPQIQIDNDPAMANSQNPGY